MGGDRDILQHLSGARVINQDMLILCHDRVPAPPLREGLDHRAIGQGDDVGYLNLRRRGKTDDNQTHQA